MQPTRAGPAPVLVQHCAAQPTAVATVFNLLPVGRRACARRARARAGHLMLAACSWTSLGAPRHPLGPLSLFLEAPPLCSLSLARTRTQPSPPTRTTAATGPPSPRRRVHGLRLDALILPVDPLDARCLKTPFPTSSSSSAATDPHRRLVAVRPSPSSKRPPLQPP